MRFRFEQLAHGHPSSALGQGHDDPVGLTSLGDLVEALERARAVGTSAALLGAALAVVRHAHDLVAIVRPGFDLLDELPRQRTRAQDEHAVGRRHGARMTA